MGPPTAWLLNFESDEELSIGGRFTPSAGLARELARLRAKNGQYVMAPGDRELGEGCEGMRAEAWCPTPRALELIRKARAIPPAAPSFDILRLVNSRKFCAGLPGDDAEAFFAADEAALLNGLTQARPRDGWLFKRNFGTSGRGQMRLAGDVPTGKEIGWVASSWRNGGLRVEPYRTLDVEFTIHGWLDKDGGYTIGDPCIQTTDSRGAWQNTRRAEPGELAPEELSAFHLGAEQSGGALAQAGYFGPFGIDAYRWHAADGRVQFQPRSEINARYTLGWRVGFGDRRLANA